MERIRDIENGLSLAGRRALVTGASLGIGRAIALLMARRGATVVIHHSSAVDAAMGYPDAAVELQHEMRRQSSGDQRAEAHERSERDQRSVPHERAEPHESSVPHERNERDERYERGASDERAECHRLDIDLIDAGSARRVVDEAIAAVGAIDIAVHAASVQDRESFAEVSAGTIDHQVRINFTATLELLQALVAHMAPRKSGRIIAIGSINQVRPHPELMVYASLKAAQHNLIVGIAKQHAANGMTANTISPGLITTPRNDFRRRDIDDWARIQKSANPMGRAGTVEEVAQLAALLAAPAGAFITGADIAIDGGARL